MFTGIIQEVGIIKNIQKANFEVGTKKILHNKKVGDSIAVNGVCVTITKITKTTFKFDAIEETLKRTNLKSLKKNSKVNLEPALTLSQTIDGHLIQGHIDTEGTVVSLKKHKNDTTLKIKFPEEIARFLAFKGGIAINGVSLTISHLEENTFEVELIPHTIKNTNLGILKKSDKINLEIDLIARYLDRLLSAKENEAKYYFLKERNLI